MTASMRMGTSFTAAATAWSMASDSLLTRCATSQNDYYGYEQCEEKWGMRGHKIKYNQEG